MHRRQGFSLTAAHLFACQRDADTAFTWGHLSETPMIKNSSFRRKPLSLGKRQRYNDSAVRVSERRDHVKMAIGASIAFVLDFHVAQRLAKLNDRPETARPAILDLAAARD